MLLLSFICGLSCGAFFVQLHNILISKAKEKEGGKPSVQIAVFVQKHFDQIA